MELISIPHLHTGLWFLFSLERRQLSLSSAEEVTWAPSKHLKLQMKKKAEGNPGVTYKDNAALPTCSGPKESIRPKLSLSIGMTQHTSKTPVYLMGLHQGFASLFPVTHNSPVPRAQHNLMANPGMSIQQFLCYKTVATRSSASLSIN